MNQRELGELRRRFRPERSGIAHVYGCFVNGMREVVAETDVSLGMSGKEEQEMYLNLLKKTLSGALGRNLIDIVFSTAQVADSDEHRLLMKLCCRPCARARAPTRTRGMSSIRASSPRSICRAKTTSSSSRATPTMCRTAARTARRTS